MFYLLTIAFKAELDWRRNIHCFNSQQSSTHSHYNLPSNPPTFISIASPSPWNIQRISSILSLRFSSTLDFPIIVIGSFPLPLSLAACPEYQCSKHSIEYTLGLFQHRKSILFRNNWTSFSDSTSSSSSNSTLHSWALSGDGYVQLSGFRTNGRTSKRASECCSGHSTSISILICHDWAEVLVMSWTRIAEYCISACLPALLCSAATTLSLPLSFIVGEGRTRSGRAVKCANQN